MKCPHCLVSFHDFWHAVSVGNDYAGHWGIRRTLCPACSRATLFLGRRRTEADFGSTLDPNFVNADFMFYPKAPARAPLPAEVPQNFAEDYTEACLVLADSAKSSAALSRRCLQKLLRDHVHVKPGNLDNEIQ